MCYNGYPSITGAALFDGMNLKGLAWLPEEYLSQVTNAFIILAKWGMSPLTLSEYVTFYMPSIQVVTLVARAMYARL